LQSGILAGTMVTPSVTTALNMHAESCIVCYITQRQLVDQCFDTCVCISDFAEMMKLNVI
jgi:hypothetical protein